MRPALVLVSLLGLTGLAAAEGEGTGTTDVNPNPGPAPAPTPAPAPAPTPTPTPVVHEGAVASDDFRPSELAFAIGVGYAFPDNVETPNVTSVRLRLVSGLTFEPRVIISNSSTDMDNGTTQTTDTDTSLTLSTLVRLPVIRRGHTDFEILGSAGLSTVKHNPDGDYNTNTVTSFSIGWGVGIAYWLSHHWQLSFQAENPLIPFQQTKQQTGPMTETKSSTSSFGVTFDPTVVVMIHLYN